MNIAKLNSIIPLYNLQRLSNITKLAPKAEEIKGASVLTGALLGLGIIGLGSVAAENKRISLEQKAKRVFSKAFMRDDITDRETVEMMKRYREIKKIKDDNEYARAMFEEAKKNFGFEDADIKFIFAEGKIHGDYQTLGKTNPLCGFIQVSKDQDRDGIADSIHHEMRHMKQQMIVKS